MKTLKVTIAALSGLMFGAAMGYLLCVWMAGYFYSPFVPSPHGIDGTAGTRYVMLSAGLVGLFIGFLASAQEL